MTGLCRTKPGIATDGPTITVAKWIGRTTSDLFERPLALALRVFSRGLVMEG